MCLAHEDMVKCNDKALFRSANSLSIRDFTKLCTYVGIIAYHITYFQYMIQNYTGSNIFLMIDLGRSLKLRYFSA